MSPFLRHALSTCAVAVMLSRPGTAQSVPPAGPAGPAAQSAFDFEFGIWDTKLRRRLEPLTGSERWVECTGLSTVRKVWDGRANLGELELTCPSGRLQGLSLRLFDPGSQQWHIRWANAADAELGPPMIGGNFQGDEHIFRALAASMGPPMSIGGNRRERMRIRRCRAASMGPPIFIGGNARQ